MLISAKDRPNKSNKSSQKEWTIEKNKSTHQSFICNLRKSHNTDITRMDRTKKRREAKSASKIQRRVYKKGKRAV